LCPTSAIAPIIKPLFPLTCGTYSSVAQPLSFILVVASPSSLPIRHLSHWSLSLFSAATMRAPAACGGGTGALATRLFSVAEERPERSGARSGQARSGWAWRGQVQAPAGRARARARALTVAGGSPPYSSTPPPRPRAPSPLLLLPLHPRPRPQAQAHRCRVLEPARAPPQGPLPTPRCSPSTPSRPAPTSCPS
jgi:hypothetical protein